MRRVARNWTARAEDASIARKGRAYRSLWRSKEKSMWDVIIIAIGLGFFALSIGYTIACDRL